MSLEGMQNYLGTPLPLELTPQQHFRLLRTVFALVFATALLIHLLMEQGDTLLATLVHAVTIAFVYVLAVGLATALLFLVHTSRGVVHVWQVWIGSLASFLVGYYLLPVDDWVAGLSAMYRSGHATQMQLYQLLPIWLVLTYLFVQPYMNRALRLELTRLQEINRLLEEQDPEPVPPQSSTVRFTVGRTDFSLETDAIRNVVVDDHYCYVHFRQNGGYAKRDLAMPLRDIHALLPDSFLHVHRSHIVNLEYVSSIARKGRAIRLTLDSGFEVPVSRHRLDHVLPKIRARLGSSRGARGQA